VTKRVEELCKIGCVPKSLSLARVQWKKGETNSPYKKKRKEIKTRYIKEKHRPNTSHPKSAGSNGVYEDTFRNSFYHGNKCGPVYEEERVQI
jgi:hypothetical protein